MVKHRAKGIKVLKEDDTHAGVIIMIMNAPTMAKDQAEVKRSR